MAELMQAMDVFLLPSFHGGLSMVAIEVQAVGLPTYVSNTISLEHHVTDLIQFLPIDSKPGTLGKRLIQDVQALPQRRDISQEIIEKWYEICSAAKKRQQFYMESVDANSHPKSI